MNNKLSTDILINEPADEYHAKADQNLSSHQLMDFMNCPLLYFKKHSGLIEDKDSSSYLLGRAAHTRILEGRDVYESEYAFGGPINPTTGKPYGSLTKKFAQWKQEQGRPVLTDDQADQIEQMVRGVNTNTEVIALLECGQAEGVVRTKYRNLPSQIRIDWLNPEKGIVDLKTTENLDWFESDARRYRYHNQMAFYQSVLKQAIGEYVPVYIIAIEKREPFRCGLWRVSDDCLAAARHENEAAIERLKSCLLNDVWPTDFEEPRILDLV